MCECLYKGQCECLAELGDIAWIAEEVWSVVVYRGDNVGSV